MAFEVGKKYICKRYYGNVVHKCHYVHKVGGGVWGLFDHPNDYIPRCIQWTADWKEYIEPRSITRWFNVWQRPDGSLNVGSITFGSKDEALRSSNRDATDGWKHLDTIEIKWIEKV